MAAASQIDAGAKTPEPRFRFAGLRIGPEVLLRIALVATFLTYAQTITYGFVYDDLLQIEMNTWIQSWNHWRQFFTGNVWSFGNVSGNYYRPVFLLWLTGNYSLFHLTPGWWHLTTIGAHVLATAMVYLLAARLLRDRWYGAVAALLFGLNPLHIESVAWVSGIPDPLLTIFFIGALLAYVRWHESRETSWLIGSLLLYGLALLSKETAMAFLPVLAVYAWKLKDECSPGERLQGLIIRLLPYAAMTAVYILARKIALAGMTNSNFPRPIGWVVATWPSALWFYMRRLLWPFQPSAVYDVDLVHGVSFGATILPLVLAAVALALFVWLGRRSNLGMLTATWVLMPLIPALAGIRVFQWNDYVHDRYAYLPSVIVAIAIASGLRWAGERVGVRIQVACVAVLAVAFGTSVVMAGRQWQSDLALFRYAHQRAPQNPLAMDYMARAIYGSGQTEQAIQQYNELLSNKPDYWQGNYVLGLAYYQMGRYDDAEKYLEIATRVWPQQFLRPEPGQFYYLGLVQQRKGNNVEAEKSLRKAVELRPGAPGYRQALATLLQRSGRDAEAREQLRLDAENRRAAAEREK
jgi:Flp pilus assembly protein TadD